MLTRVLPVLIAVVLTGCVQVPPTPTVDAKTCTPVVPSGGTKPVCTVTLKASVDSNGKCTVATVPDLYLTGGIKNSRIIWLLGDPDSFRFCQSAGDGAFLKNVDDDEQFSNGTATDKDTGDDDPVTPKHYCKKSFRLEDANTTSGVLYSYSIQFHSKRSTAGKCTFDPQIRNG